MKPIEKLKVKLRTALNDLKENESAEDIQANAILVLNVLVDIENEAPELMGRTTLDFSDLIDEVSILIKNSSLNKNRPNSIAKKDLKESVLKMCNRVSFLLQ